MLEPAIPIDEEARLATLRGLNILDTPPEERFDRITRIAQRVFDTPIALVSLIDSNRQWFKSCQGLDASETPRSISFCGHAILSSEAFVIPDAVLDPRFADNPLVTGAPHIRFYAGQPLKAINGSRLGTLCIVDRKPHHLSRSDLDTLHDLGKLIENELNILDIQDMADALRDNASRLRAILDNVAEGIITINEQGILESCNNATQHLFGYLPSEMNGNNINMLMPGLHCEQHEESLHIYLDTGNGEIIGTGCEVTGRRKDGTAFPIELAISEMQLGDKRMFTGIMRDITERKQADNRLREALTLQNAILSSANHSIISTDLNGVIQTFNAGAEKLLGYKAEELIGKQTPALFHDAGELVRRAQALSLELGRTVEPGFEVFIAKAKPGFADENEWSYIHKDGTPHPVLLSITALMNDSNTVTGYLGIATDISERKKIERMKGEFISTVSHELRTPITSIRGALGLIAGGVSGELPAQAQALVNIAHKNSERLILLVNDILDIEKIESGKMNFNMQPLQLLPLIELALEANFAYAQEFQVAYQLQHPVPGVMASVDADRFMQVMTNLLSNAAKFSPPGGTVIISMQCDGENIKISVSDRGSGIPEEFKKRIFEKFSQADSSDSRTKGGTGLGLSITKALVERMGGHVGFSSQEGVGTTFFFEFPQWDQRSHSPSQGASGTIASAG